MLKKSVLFFIILGIIQVVGVYTVVHYYEVPWEQARALVAVVSGLLGIGFVARALFAEEHPSNYLIGVFGFMLLSTAWSYGFKFDQNSVLEGVDSIIGVLPLGAAGVVLRRGEPGAPIWRIAASWILIDWVISGLADMLLATTTEGVIAATWIFVISGIVAYAVAAVGRKSYLNPSQA